MALGVLCFTQGGSRAETLPDEGSATRSTFTHVPYPSDVAAAPDRLLVTGGDSCNPSQGEILSVNSLGATTPFAVLPRNDLNCKSPSIAVPRGRLAPAFLEEGYLFAARNEVVYRIESTGRVEEFVRLPAPNGNVLITGIQFDAVGTFGGVLLAHGADPQYGSLYSICPNKTVKKIAEPDGDASVQTGAGLEVAPMDFAPYGGHLLTVHQTGSGPPNRSPIMHLPPPSDPFDLCNQGAVEVRRTQKVPEILPYAWSEAWGAYDIDFVPNRTCRFGGSDGVFFTADWRGQRLNKFEETDFRDGMTGAAVVSGVFQRGNGDGTVTVQSPLVRSTSTSEGPRLSIDTFYSETVVADEAANINYAAIQQGEFFPCPPEVSVQPVSIEEGDSGATMAVFELKRESPGPDAVTIQYRTEAAALLQASATPEIDYLPVEGERTFTAQGQVQTVEVPIRGDTLLEPDETFLMTLRDRAFPENVLGSAVGTIINDDPAPTLSIPEIPPPATQPPDLNLPSDGGGAGGGPPGSLSGQPAPNSQPSAPAGISASQGSQPPPAPPSGASAPSPFGAQAPSFSPGGGPVSPEAGSAASVTSYSPVPAEAAFPVPAAAGPPVPAGLGSPFALPGVQTPEREADPQAAPNEEFGMVRFNPEGDKGVVLILLLGTVIPIFCFASAVGISERRRFRPCPAGVAGGVRAG